MSDLVFRSREESVIRAHALVTEHLTFTKAYMTWSKEANEVEDVLGWLWNQVQDERLDSERALSKLTELENALKRIKVSYDEWETLFREKLILERALLLSFTKR